MVQVRQGGQVIALLTGSRNKPNPVEKQTHHFQPSPCLLSWRLTAFQRFFDRLSSLTTTPPSRFFLLLQYMQRTHEPPTWIRAASWRFMTYATNRTLTHSMEFIRSLVSLHAKIWLVYLTDSVRLQRNHTYRAGSIYEVRWTETLGSCPTTSQPTWTVSRMAQFVPLKRVTIFQCHCQFQCQFNPPDWADRI